MARSTVYLGLAAARGGPGVAMHLRAWSLAAGILLRERNPAARAIAHGLLFSPMDSVRYFELDFAWRATRGLASLGRFVDISSPRLWPVAVMRGHPRVEAVLVNPDVRDLEVTRALVEGCGVAGRCRLEGVRADQLAVPEGSVDLVTSLSVVEHIPSGADVETVARMWSWIRPGGRLVLTVPCAREAFEEYTDFDEYGLLPRDEAGFVLGQRFYDQAILDATFFRICGPPRHLAIFGERRAGAFFADRDRKLRGMASWEREPYSVAASYRPFRAIDELPGIGVIAMEFQKSPAS